MAYLLNGIPETRRRESLQGNGGTWWRHRIILPAGFTATTGDVFDIFDYAQIVGYEVLDYFVIMQRVDTNASPTVAWNIGIAGDSSGISGTTGLRWATGVTTLGRTAQTSLYRAQNGDHVLMPGHSNRIGLSLSVAPATPEWDGKFIEMGLLLVPAAI